MALGNRLEDKVAIVTGAGTRGEIAGTGQAASILMAREGAKILLCDIDIDRAEETLNVIEKEGGIGKIFVGDVTSEKDCEAMINESIKQFGKLLPNDFNNNQMLFDLYNGFSGKYKLFKIISDTKN